MNGKQEPHKLLESTAEAAGWRLPWIYKEWDKDKVIRVAKKLSDYLYTTGGQEESFLLENGLSPIGRGSGVSAAPRTTVDELEEGVERSRFLQKKFYGRSIQLTVEVANSRRTGEPTLQFEGSRKVRGGYDHQNKLVVQVVPRDLPSVAAVILCKSDYVKLEHYGDCRNKILEVKRDEGSTIVRLTQRDRTDMKRLDSSDLFDVCGLAIIALQRRFPELDHESLLYMLQVSTNRS